MKLFWTHILTSRAYQRATASQRRLIEIRFAAGRALCAKRRAARLTQLQLANRMGAAQSTISRLERGSRRATLDQLIEALIALDCSDDEIGLAFNPAARKDIEQLRSRASARFYPRPAPAR